MFADRRAVLPPVFAVLLSVINLGGCGGGAPAQSGSGGHGTGGIETPGTGGSAIDAPGTGGVDDSGSGGVTGDDGGDDEESSDGGSDLVADAGGDGGSCPSVVEQHMDYGYLHTLNNCDPVTYATNPPSSGTHYPNWADYRIWDKPVPWGFLVHELEHGAVVISYRCPAGCNVDLTDVRNFLATLPPDDVCLSRKLISVVPDPNLDVAFAASAWTWTLRADCFDPVAFGDFVSQHYAHGLERICGGGIDLSATGWCP